MAPARHRRPKPPVVQVLVAATGVLLLAGGYLVAMHLVVDVSRLAEGESSDHRDAVYLAVHAAAVFAAAVLGFALGKWVSGLGFAFAVLLVSAMLVAMVAAQFVSFSLACNGHNDLIRHWQC